MHTGRNRQTPSDTPNKGERTPNAGEENFYFLSFGKGYFPIGFSHVLYLCSVFFLHTGTSSGNLIETHLFTLNT